MELANVITEFTSMGQLVAMLGLPNPDVATPDWVAGPISAVAVAVTYDECQGRSGCGCLGGGRIGSGGDRGSG